MMNQRYVIPLREKEWENRLKQYHNFDKIFHKMIGFAHYVKLTIFVIKNKDLPF